MWGELVHIEAYYFRTGEHPWTGHDFYNNSVLQREAPATVGPVVLTLWEHDGPRVAENDGWWENDGVWWGMAGDGFRFEQYLPLDDDLRLTADVVRFHLTPLTIQAGDRDEPQHSMLEYMCRSDGQSFTFEGHLDDLKRLCDQHSKGKSYVALLTLWSCSAGWSYIPGEPDEYESDWQLIGAVLPHANGVTFQALEDE